MVKKQDSGQPDPGAPEDPKAKKRRRNGRLDAVGKAEQADHHSVGQRSGPAEGNDPSLARGKTWVRVVGDDD